MDNIIDPIATELIEAELTPERFLRHANKGGNDIYVVTASDAPNTMREIGRLREIAFRAAGGGTGKDCDIDEFDMMENPCRQLIVWNPVQKMILGAYRFLCGTDIVLEPNGSPRIATGHMFRFSERFLRDYLPHTIELGRSFVRTEFQSSRAGSAAIYVLDNLWDGLGALTHIYPDMRYLFGKVTMYPSYTPECRSMIYYFLSKHFSDPDNLVRPIKPFVMPCDKEKMDAELCGADFNEDFKLLNNYVRARGNSIPPLVHAYMSLSPTMRIFGTAINDEFGDVEETGIFLTIDEILEEKKQRHIATFQP